ncbi:MAG: hypothetical protein H6825_07175 [Planctomycetes bacterium]|nr:hypothetical protein [Planctomycetota bacterium]
MKRVLSVLLLALVVLAPSASSQILDGAWFKVSVSAKGLGFSPEGETGKASGKFTVYMFVQAAGGKAADISGDDYTFVLYGEVGDVWQIVSSGAFTTPVDRTAMVGDPVEGITLDVPVPPSFGGGGDSIAVHFVAKLKVKLDKQDALKKAAFKSLGGLIPSGTADGFPVVGGAKVSGKTVDPTKLPFPLIG